MKKIKFPKTHFLIAIYVLIVLVLIVLSFLFFTSPKIIKASPGKDATDISLDSEIRINFSGPINRNVLIPEIEPEIPGEWRYENSLIGRHLFRTLVFVPQEIFHPQEKYTIKLQDVEGIFKIDRVKYQYSFITQSLPTIKSVKLEDNRQIKVKLNRPNPQFLEYDFIIEPTISFDIQLNQTQDEYTLSCQNELLANMDYSMKIYSTFVVKDKETGERVYEEQANESFETILTAEAKITSYQSSNKPQSLIAHAASSDSKTAYYRPAIITYYYPRGSGVRVENNITIRFSREMNRASVEKYFYILPRTQGTFSWSEDSREMIFTPSQNLNYATLYKIIISRYAQDREGRPISRDKHFYVPFQTIGRVTARIYPRYGSKGVGVKSYVRVYFNQYVDRESAISHFRITPEVSGHFSFSYTEKRMYFVPDTRFSYMKNYRVYIYPGVKSIDGLDSSQYFTTRFTTQLYVKRLGIRIDFQDYPLSCEAAALKMALAYKHRRISERSILSRIRIDWQKRQWNRWADPYRIFVGSLYGRQNSTGYGVYWQPIARAGRAWRPSTKAYCRMSISSLTSEIKKGNPVIAWGVYGNGYPDSWYSWGGKYIYAWKGEHARTVIGFIGSARYPRKIIINDPYVGRLYWSTSKFIRDWNRFGRCGVVVR